MTTSRMSTALPVRVVYLMDTQEEEEEEQEGEQEGEVNSSVTSVGSQATGGQGAHSARWIRPRKTGRSRVSSSCASFSSFKIHTSELISIGS